MKISSIATLLAVSAPLVSSASGGLKGTERKLAEPGSYANNPDNWKQTESGEQLEIPGLDQLNAIYGTFCDICNFVGQLSIDALLGVDAQFCVSLCEIVPEIPDPADIPTCFSEISTVQVENLGSVTMKDLKLGAKVLTQSGTYEPVYAFGHRNPTKSADFLQFQTEESNLEMTGGHLVFLEGKSNPVRADSIKVGDVFQGKNAEVTKINTVQRDGVYSPLTPSGTVIVDGIAASSYISLQKESNEFVELQGGFSTFMSFHDGIHMALSPFRMFTMGVSSSLGNIYTEDGVPVYASYAMDFANWVNNQNILVQFFFFLAVGALAGASMFVENTFGASMGPLVLVAGAGAYAMMKKNGIAFSFSASKIKSI